VDKYRDVSLTGIKGKVVKKIEPGIPGKVELYSAYHGIKEWSAEADAELNENEEIQVLEADGIKLIVKKNT
jgi:membrane protein implicated in regulation of membrane protease activity